MFITHFEELFLGLTPHDLGGGRFKLLLSETPNDATHQVHCTRSYCTRCSLMCRWVSHWRTLAEAAPSGCNVPLLHLGRRLNGGGWGGVGGGGQRGAHQQGRGNRIHLHTRTKSLPLPFSLSLSLKTRTHISVRAHKCNLGRTCQPIEPFQTSEERKAARKKREQEKRKPL